MQDDEITIKVKIPLQATSMKALDGATFTLYEYNYTKYSFDDFPNLNMTLTANMREVGEDKKEREKRERIQNAMSGLDGIINDLDNTYKKLTLKEIEKAKSEIGFIKSCIWNDGDMDFSFEADDIEMVLNLCERYMKSEDC